MCVCVIRLGRRRCFLLSISLSSLLGVAVCLSNSAMMFLLLRLSQGSVLAGVFVSSYISSECPAHTFNCCPGYPMVPLPVASEKSLRPELTGKTALSLLTSLFILEATLEFLHFTKLFFFAFSSNKASPSCTFFCLIRSVPSQQQNLNYLCVSICCSGN